MDLVDAHVHAYEYEEEDWSAIAGMGGRVIMVAVSEDLESSRRTLGLTPPPNLRLFNCVGIHPWNAHKVGSGEIRELETLVGENRVDCIGEVGVDKRFVPQTWEAQVRVFEEMLELAREHGLPVNIHAAGAWREALVMVLRHRVERALFHWYTGPLDVLGDIVDAGYLVSVNAAAEIQAKQRAIIEKAPLESMVTESDGPYEYRGLRLSTTLLPKLLGIIAELKGEEVEAIARRVWQNFTRGFIAP